jgi:mRNA interferase MazF
MYKQLEIWWIDLNPTRGFETQKKRPCVVLQSNLFNKGSKTFIVAPILPHHKAWNFAVNVTPSQSNRLDKERHINVKQIRVIDVSRFDNKHGVLENNYLLPIRKALNLVFGF